MIGSARMSDKNINACHNWMSSSDIRPRSNRSSESRCLPSPLISSVDCLEQNRRRSKWVLHARAPIRSIWDPKENSFTHRHITINNEDFVIDFPSRAHQRAYSLPAMIYRVGRLMMNNEQMCGEISTRGERKGQSLFGLRDRSWGKPTRRADWWAEQKQIISTARMCIHLASNLEDRCCSDRVDRSREIMQDSRPFIVRWHFKRFFCHTLTLIVMMLFACHAIVSCLCHPAPFLSIHIRRNMNGTLMYNSRH